MPSLAHHARPAVALVLVAAALGSRASADRPVARAPEQALVAVFLAADDAELARLGRQASSPGLRRAIGSPDRLAALAAIAAAPAADDAWVLLDILADLAGGADRPLAAAAADTASRIAGALDRSLALDLAMPPDALAQRMRAWRDIGARTDRWADVRVLAMQTATALSGALDGNPPAYDLAAAAADPDPEIRRAALELLPSPLSADQLAVAARALATDPSPSVALAAAQAACSGLAFDDPRPPIVAALGDAGIARLRQLVADDKLSPSARTDAGRCVGSGGP